MGHSGTVFFVQEHCGQITSLTHGSFHYNSVHGLQQISVPNAWNDLLGKYV